MIKHENTGIFNPPAPQDVDLMRLSKAGRQIAKSLTIAPASRTASSSMRKHYRVEEQTLHDVVKAASINDVNGRWLIENYRLIRTAQKETHRLATSFRNYRTVSDQGAGLLPLPYVVAKSYLSASFDFFTEEGLTGFLNGFQEIHELAMAELWALKPSLQLVLLERVVANAAEPGTSLPVILDSLRTAG